MPGNIGREVLWHWGDNGEGEANDVAGIREKQISLAGTPVDVSDDDSAGWRELLETMGRREVNISISGVTKSNTLKVDWFGGTTIKASAIEYPDGGVLAGMFKLVNYSETASNETEITFQAEVQSTGVVTYVAAGEGEEGEG